MDSGLQAAVKRGHLVATDLKTDPWRKMRLLGYQTDSDQADY